MGYITILLSINRYNIDTNKQLLIISNVMIIIVKVLKHKKKKVNKYAHITLCTIIGGNLEGLYLQWVGRL